MPNAGKRRRAAEQQDKTQSQGADGTAAMRKRLRAPQQQDPPVVAMSPQEPLPLPGHVLRLMPNLTVRRPDWNPFLPFPSPYEYKLARWLHEGKVSLVHINRFMKLNLHHGPAQGPPSGLSFQSGQTLRKKLKVMVESSLPPWSKRTLILTPNIQPFFYTRDILPCVAYLLRQAAFRKHMVYAPVKEFDGEGHRVFAEMHTADWWNDMQVGTQI